MAPSIVFLCSRIRLDLGVVNVEDAPSAITLAAYGRAVAGAVLHGRIEDILVGVPQRVADHLHLIHLESVMHVGRVLEETVLQVADHLLSSDEFAVRRVHHHFGIETFLELGHISLTESGHARLHGILHGFVCRTRVLNVSAHGCHAMLQVNRHAHLVEQIHAEDAVNRPAAGRTDGAQVDRRQFEIAQRVFPYRELSNETSRALVAAVPVQEAM